ncbi:hypothetical protein KSS87_022731, partial [Heliosperma pusillum]
MTNINILYVKIKHVLQPTKFQITNPKLKRTKSYKINKKHQKSKLQTQIRVLQHHQSIISMSGSSRERLATSRQPT